VLGTLVQIFRIISEVENVSVMDLTTKKKKNYNKGPVASLKTFKHHVNLLYQKRLILYLCGNGMVVKVFGFSSCLLEYFLTNQHALHTQYKNFLTNLWRWWIKKNFMSLIRPCIGFGTFKIKSTQMVTHQINLKSNQ
jgi:hypothetical protein